MSKTFLTLDKTESLKVSILSIQNALVLKDTAISAANKNNFGVATSLMILSTEEIIKAQVLFFQGIGIHIQKYEGAKKLFSNHADKHQFASLLQLSKIAEGLINAFNYKAEDKEYKTDVKFVNLMLKRLRKISNTLAPFKLLLKSIIEMQENVKWLKEANSLKNMGLYINIKGLPQSPKSIPYDTYIKYKTINDESYTLFRIIKIGYNKYSSEKDIEILIKDINNNIIPKLKKDLTMPIWQLSIDE